MSNLPIDNAGVHRILREAFTDRYLAAPGLGKIAFSLPYNAENSLCDYDRTTWEAKPNAVLGTRAANLILGKMHHLDGKEIEEHCVQPFTRKVSKLTNALQEYPVLLVNGHAPDLQAALSSFSAVRAIAHSDSGRFGKNFKDMVAINHAVGTRGFAPVVIGRANTPFQKPLVEIARWIMNPHLSLPNNKRMRESALPASFKSSYNEKFKAGLFEAVQGEPTHPKGYHALVSTPPGGTRDEPGHDKAGNEIMVTAKVEQGTIDLVRAMKCGLLPVYTVFGMGKGPTLMRPGTIVPPNEVYDKTLPSLMADLARFRRYQHEGEIFYAEEPEVAR